MLNADMPNKTTCGTGCVAGFNRALPQNSIGEPVEQEQVSRSGLSRATGRLRGPELVAPSLPRIACGTAVSVVAPVWCNIVATHISPVLLLISANAV
jgi:hypothetical protein